MKLSEMHDAVADLEARVEALQQDAVPLREQLGNIDRTLGKLGQEKGELLQQIKTARQSPRVSDHAVIRYLERKHGFSFEKVRKELLTPEVVRAMDAGADGVKVNGCTLKIKGRTVATCI